MWEHAGLIVAVCGFLLQIGVTLVAVTRALDKTEASLRQTITQTKDEIEERQDRMSREFGETVQAIRQKVHEVETWARDEFMRKEDFEMVREDIVRLADKLEARLVRMEAKLDARH